MTVTPMRPSEGTLARFRPVAAPLLLALFLANVEVGPAVHLATHRRDHSHRPDPGARTHEAEGHDDGSGVHGHEDPRGGRAWRIATVGAHGHHDDADHDDDDTPVRPLRGAGLGATGDETEHHHDQWPDSDHGDGSSAHFLLALVDEPPPLLLPPPRETRAAPSAAAVETCRPTPLPPPPPARGPPRLP